MYLPISSTCLSACASKCGCISKRALTPQYKIGNPIFLYVIKFRIMNRSTSNPRCPICKENHARTKLFIVAPSQKHSERVTIIMDSNEKCLVKLKTLEAFKMSESTFYNNQETEKNQRESNRLWLSPQKLSPQDFWIYCEKIEALGKTISAATKTPSQTIVKFNFS